MQRRFTFYLHTIVTSNAAIRDARMIVNRLAPITRNMAIVALIGAGEVISRFATSGNIIMAAGTGAVHFNMINPCYWRP
jgi:hypothetical protein